MARIAKGFKAVSVKFPVDLYEVLDDTHWTSRREINDIVVEAVAAALSHSLEPKSK